MALLRFAFRNLKRNRLRSGVTMLGVASLLFLVSFLVSIILGMNSATDRDTTHLRLVVSNKISLTFALPESYWNRIRTLPHVVEVSPSSWFGGTYIDQKHFFARFFVDPETLLKIKPELKMPKEQVAAWLGDRQGAIVDAKLAEREHFKVGQRITLTGDIYPIPVELNIDAIFTGGQQELYFHRAYVEEATGRPGHVGTYWVQVDAPENLASVSAAIDKLFENSDDETKTQSEKAFQAGFVQMFGNVKGLVRNLTLILAVTILLTAGNTMAMAIRERTREIAVLKAVGFVPSRILGLVLAESVALSGLAGILGIGTFWSITYLVFVILKFQIPMLWFPLTLTPLAGILLLAGSLLLGIVSGIAPAAIAARLSVVDGLRSN
ncbi:MAG: FtsX-like permease family protein [Acidobacteriota bacterium]